eukprot:scaffold9836_cov26-Tisochrysis_lutea.AAC.3
MRGMLLLIVGQGGLPRFAKGLDVVFWHQSHDRPQVKQLNAPIASPLACNVARTSSGSLRRRRARSASPDAATDNGGGDAGALASTPSPPSSLASIAWAISAAAAESSPAHRGRVPTGRVAMASAAAATRRRKATPWIALTATSLAGKSVGAAAAAAAAARRAGAERSRGGKARELCSACNAAGEADAWVHARNMSSDASSSMAVEASLPPSRNKSPRIEASPARAPPNSPRVAPRVAPSASAKPVECGSCPSRASAAGAGATAAIWGGAPRRRSSSKSSSNWQSGDPPAAAGSWQGASRLAPSENDGASLGAGANDARLREGGRCCKSCPSHTSATASPVSSISAESWPSHTLTVTPRITSVDGSMSRSRARRSVASAPSARNIGAKRSASPACAERRTPTQASARGSPVPRGASAADESRR